MAYKKGMKAENESIVETVLPLARGLFSEKTQRDLNGSNLDLRGEAWNSWRDGLSKLDEEIEKINPNLSRQRRSSIAAKTLRTIRSEWRAARAK